MNREDLVHVLQAAADIVDGQDIVLIGSQAILAEHPNAPAELLVSLEADVYPRDDPERAIEISGAIGDGTLFASTYTYHAHGVGPETPVAPAGWEARLVRLPLPRIMRGTGEFSAWCMSTHDLVVAKLVAGRAKDIAFVTTAIREGLVDIQQLRLGIDLLPVSHAASTRERLEIILARLRTP